MAERKVRTSQGRIPRESEGGSLQGGSTDSATENIPPPSPRLRRAGPVQGICLVKEARVKWWGKSPPPLRAIERAGQAQSDARQNRGQSGPLANAPGMSRLFRKGLALCESDK